MSVDIRPTAPAAARRRGLACRPSSDSSRPPGEYAEGDVFIGVTVQTCARCCREWSRRRHPCNARSARLAGARRAAARPVLLVEAFKRGTDTTKRRSIVSISRTRSSSTTGISSTVGGANRRRWLSTRSRAPLRAWPGRRLCGNAASPSSRRCSSFGRMTSPRRSGSRICCAATSTI